MKCPASNGDWCAYSTNSHCWWEGAPNPFAREKCDGARLVPCQPIDAELLFECVYNEGERKAQVDVMSLILAKATPTDPLNPINRAQCDVIRELCTYYLTFMKRGIALASAQLSRSGRESAQPTAYRRSAHMSGKKKEERDVDNTRESSSNNRSISAPTLGSTHPTVKWSKVEDAGEWV